MKFAKETALNNRPHPGPLPRGEGAANVQFAFYWKSYGQSSRRLFCEAAYDSPSPGGEGRGEGGRNN
jgi:hypothetical protein